MSNCTVCIAIAKATRNEVFETCPGHKNSDAIARLANVSPVSTAAVLHVLCSRSPKALALVAEKTELPIAVVRTVAKASDVWHMQHAG